ncbi:hypothetical protein [Streptomyces sp. NPDC126503]|uniref:hypothetical protein n=1 Tax=Streptomyces sp. NPDC126503 TaxID=3155315 RepID=UPI003324E5D6
MSGTSTATETSGKPAGRRRAALTAALVLTAVGGGITFTAVTAAGADRTAPTVAWADPTATAHPEGPAAALAEGRASTPLSRLLLPVPDGYKLGADIEGYGNDGELGAEQAAAFFKQRDEDLYGKKRREYEKRVDQLGIQGMAARSYATAGNDLHIEVFVLRMKDRKAVRAFSGFRTSLLEAEELTEGPEVEGHGENAACYLATDSDGSGASAESGDNPGSPLQGMLCSAYDGEVMVTVAAFGADPFDSKGVAELVKKQLDHIQSPGEYV